MSTQAPATSTASAWRPMSINDHQGLLQHRRTAGSNCPRWATHIHQDAGRGQRRQCRTPRPRRRANGTSRRLRHAACRRRCADQLALPIPAGFYVNVHTERLPERSGPRQPRLCRHLTRPQPPTLPPLGAAPMRSRPPTHPRAAGPARGRRRCSAPAPNRSSRALRNSPAGGRSLRWRWTAAPCPDHRAIGAVQRIEQCGDRLVVTAAGIIHDMRCDGTEAGGVHDVAEMQGHRDHRRRHLRGRRARAPAGRLPIEVKRWRDWADDLMWQYLGFTARLERVGPPSVVPHDVT